MLAAFSLGDVVGVDVQRRHVRRVPEHLADLHVVPPADKLRGQSEGSQAADCRTVADRPASGPGVPATQSPPPSDRAESTDGRPPTGKQLGEHREPVSPNPN